jgi:hypothetical protein
MKVLQKERERTVYNLHEIDASDAALIDELNKDIEETQKDLEDILDILDEMHVEVVDQGFLFA